jgi:hypothetical protein
VGLLFGEIRPLGEGAAEIGQGVRSACFVAALSPGWCGDGIDVAGQPRHELRSRLEWLLDPTEQVVEVGVSHRSTLHRRVGTRPSPG